MNVGGWFSDVVWCCEIGLWVLHYWLSAVVVIILLVVGIVFVSGLVLFELLRSM